MIAERKATIDRYRLKDRKQLSPSRTRSERGSARMCTTICSRPSRHPVDLQYRQTGREFLGLADAGQTWHTDTSYRARPSRGSILYAIEIPHDENGNPIGDTLFAGTGPCL